MVRLLAILAILAGAAKACTQVDGARILGADLARAERAFAALPADLVVGFAPTPGVRRVIDARTLAGIARSAGFVWETPASLCFERRTQILEESAVRQALEHASGEGARVEIVDYSRYPVPAGEIEFKETELPRPAIAAADPSVVWRGRVRYDGRSTVAIWAKVRITRLERWVETVSAIPARSRIGAQQVVLKSGWRHPFATAPIQELNQVIGKQAARSLRAGQPLTATLVEEPNAVESGDAVDVEVSSGGVSLRFSARAETGGRISQPVLVTATDSGKRYRAYVEEKGKVVIHADGQKYPNRTGEHGDLRDASGRNHTESEETDSQRAGIGVGQIPE